MVLILGFTSGLPFALTSSTLQAWLSESHINIHLIGALSLLGIPYTLKFLWAPLLDHFGFKSLGKRRGWILITQLGTAFTLFLMAGMQPSTQINLMMTIAFFVVFLSATQDIAIDAYRTDILQPQEMGLGASYFVLSYRIALLVAGGLALIIADQWGWRLTYQFMGCLILFTMIPTWFAPQPKEYVSQSLEKTFVAGIKDLFQRDKIIILLLFVVLYKFGDALALSLMTNFLINGLGFSLSEIAFAYKFMGIIATILGGFVGGILLLRWDIYRGLLVFGLAQAFSNLMFVVLALTGKVVGIMAFAIFVENFCSGLSTAAFFAYLMSICNHRYTAAQYALLTAIFSLGRVFLGPVAAVIVENFGWIQLFLWAFVMCFPGILMLILLKDRVLYHAQFSTK